MALGLKENQSNVVQGLNTYTYTIQTAGYYRIEVQANEIPPSGLIATINLNGSPLSPSPSPIPATAQSHLAVQVNTLCAINDVISVVLSSAAASDTLINTVHAIITLTRRF